MMTRTVALLSHDRNPDAITSAARIGQALRMADIKVVQIPRTDHRFSQPAARRVPEVAQALHNAEIMLVIGGDGTILRAADLTYGTHIPILGINYGHMGFLAEADPDSMDHVINAIKHEQWSVDARMTIDVEIALPDGTRQYSWALNEASVEKDPVTRMVEAEISIDNVPLSAFSCDTVLVSTPTGSTAYAFSAGGPVVWPDVEAIVVTPVAAHALFARPLVVSPDSRISVRVESENAHVWCDGRRLFSAPAGTTVTVQRGTYQIPLARLNSTPFTQRLVRKFNLPTHGWRHGGQAS